MKLTSLDIQNIRSALSACKVVGIELAVMTNQKIMGVNDKKDAAIISDLKLSVAQDLKIGIGRLMEFEKRLNLFPENMEADLKVNADNEVTLITLSSGKSKMQFRCTAMSLLDKKYPQANADVPHVVVELSKQEVSQLVKAAKGLSAENVIVKVGKNKEVRIECSDSNNDQFVVVLEKEASFVEQEESVVFIYSADRFTSVIDAIARDNEEISLVIGEGGSLTADVRGHLLIIMPQATGE